MDGNLRMQRDLATWPARRLEKMGLCCRAARPTRLAFFRLLSSPVGISAGELLVHLLMDSGSVEFLDKT